MDGTAIGGSDYVPGVILITFQPGELTQTVDIGIIDDDIVEGEENFVLALELQDPSQQDAQILIPYGSIIIEDDDGVQSM